MRDPGSKIPVRGEVFIERFFDYVRRINHEINRKSQQGHSPGKRVFEVGVIPMLSPIGERARPWEKKGQKIMYKKNLPKTP